jgi:hypothetical protein
MRIGKKSISLMLNTQHNVYNILTANIYTDMLNAVTLGVVMLCWFGECCYAESCNIESRYAEEH